MPVFESTTTGPSITSRSGQSARSAFVAWQPGFAISRPSGGLTSGRPYDHAPGAIPYQRSATASSRSRCAPERSTTTPSSGGPNAAASSWPRQRKSTSAPLAAASAFETKAGSDPFSRGSSVWAGLPACESEPSASTSIEGCPSRRSSVSCPVYPAVPRIAAVGICVLCTIVQTMQRLVLEDGTVFEGTGVGAAGVAAGEACFTTAMTGYEEAVTDPSYVAQVLCFAYPLIGTYGVEESRMESERVQCEGVVMRDVRPEFAGWLRERGVVALAGVDTRTLVRRIRDEGVVRCALGDAPVEELHARALAEPPIDGRPLDRRVGTAVPYSVGAGPRVVVLDLGTKYSIPRRLAAAGVEAFVVPGSWDAEAILDEHPAAVLVSNGPGDPAVLVDQIDTIRGLLGRVPVFGICL